MIKVSDELLNDNVFNLESYIAKEFARRIGTNGDEASFVSDGAGKLYRGVSSMLQVGQV